MSTKEKMENAIQTMTPEQKAQNLNSLLYIKTLAAQSSADISSWDINKIFGVEGDDMNLISDKREINKRFLDAFEKAKIKAEKKAEKNPQEQEINKLLNIATLKTAVEEAAKNARKTQIAEQQRQLTENERVMNNKLTEYNRYHDAVLLCRQNIRNLENTSDDTSVYDKCFADIQKLIDTKMWVNPVFENGYLYLNTSTSIMLQEINKAANININLDFGQLAVRINVAQGFNINVIPYKNNIVVNNCWHPHVYNDARPCWGEANTVAMKAIANLEIAKALELLHAILNNYNKDSPITRLADFKLNGVKMGRVAENIKHPDKRKPPKPVAPQEQPLENVGAVLGQAIVPATIPITTDGY